MAYSTELDVWLAFRFFFFFFLLLKLSPASASLSPVVVGELAPTSEPLAVVGVSVLSVEPVAGAGDVDNAASGGPLLSELGLAEVVEFTVDPTSDSIVVSGELLAPTVVGAVVAFVGSVKGSAGGGELFGTFGDSSTVSGAKVELTGESCMGLPVSTENVGSWFGG